MAGIFRFCARVFVAAAIGGGLFAAGDSFAQEGTVFYGTTTPEAVSVTDDNFVIFKGDSAGTVTATIIAVTGTVTGGTFVPAANNATGMVFVTLRGLDSCNITDGCDAFGLEGLQTADARLATLLAMGLRTVTMFASSGANLNEQVNQNFLLFHLATANRPGRFSVLMTAGASVDAKGAGGRTPLHNAATLGLSSAVTILLTAGADMDAQDSDGKTPLHYAAGRGDTVLVSILLTAGADADAQDNSGATPLDDALNANRGDVINALTLAGGMCGTQTDSRCPGFVGPPAISLDVVLPNTVFVVRDSALTVLGHIANAVAHATVSVTVVPPEWASVRVVGGEREVVFAGSDAGTVTAGVLAFAGSSPTASLLITLRALAGCGISDGCDAFGLEEAGNRGGRLASLIAMDLRTVTMFAASGADVNENLAFNAGGYLIYHLATADKPGHISVFVAAGGSVDGRDFSERTPLYYAILRNHFTAFTILLSAGADANARRSGGNSHLHVAASGGRLAMAATLLSLGAEVNATNSGGVSPLYSAAGNEGIGVATLLLSAGADVNLRTGTGNTPLHNAAFWRRGAVASVLLLAGGSVNATANDGDTPLDDAIKRNAGDVIDALTLAGGICGTQTDSRCPGFAGPPAISLDVVLPNTVFVVRGSALTVLGHIANAVAHATVSVTVVPPEWASVRVVDGEREVVFAGTEAGTVTAGVLAFAGSSPTASLLITLRALAGCGISDGCDAFGFEGAGDAGGRLASLIAMDLRTVTMFVASGADLEEEVGAGFLHQQFLLFHLATANKPGHISVFVDAGADVNARGLVLGRGALHNAAGEGLTAAVSLLLAEGADVHLPTGAEHSLGAEDGRTALHFAALGGDAGMLSLLLAEGASVYGRDLAGRSGLMLAAGSGSVAAVTVLLSAAASVNAFDESGDTALHFAAIAGSGGAATALLSAGASVNARADSGLTPLFPAVIKLRTAVVSILLSAGASVNLRGDNFDGETALHKAARSGWGAGAEFLLAASANVNAKGNNGGTPADVAVEESNAGVLTVLLAAGGLCNLDGGGGVCPGIHSRIPSSGNTTLHIAAQRGATATLSKWLAAGASINARNNDGGTPLGFAARFGRTAAVTLLVDAGAGVNLAGSGGLLPLHFAAAFRLGGMASVLIANGGSVDAVDDRGLAALHFAVRGGAVAPMTLLLAAGASVNAVDENGYTPLHFAASAGFVDGASVLLAASGVGVNLENDAGETPLDLAVRRGERDILGLLMDNGGVCSAVDAALCLVPDIGFGEGAGFSVFVARGGGDGFAGRAGFIRTVTANRTDVGFGVSPGGLLSVSSGSLFFTGRDAGTLVGTVLGVIAGGATVRLPVTVRALDSCSVSRGCFGFFGLTNGVAQRERVSAFLGMDLATVTMFAASGADLHEEIGIACGGALSYHLAAGNRLDAVSALLTAGADIDSRARGCVHETPLHYAALVGNAAAVSGLLSLGAGADVANGSGETPLHYVSGRAREGGDYGGAASLLLAAAGADVNARERRQRTPLHYAANSQNGGALGVLLSAEGVDVNALDNLNLTPLDLLFQRSPRDGALVDALLIAGGRCTSRQAECLLPQIGAGAEFPNTVFVVRGGDVSGVGFVSGLTANRGIERYSASPSGLLTAVGADVFYAGTQAGTMTGTVFGFAGALSGSVFVTVRGLQSCGINGGCAAFGLEDAADAGGRLASLFAMHLRTVTMFAASGADLNEGVGGNTADKFLLYHLATANKGDIVSVFVSDGADINAGDGEGQTPLHRAAFADATLALTLLLSAGANSDARENAGGTPLHIAAAGGRTLAVSVLLSAGADVNATTNIGETPLHIAASLGHIPAIGVLLSAGASVNAADGEGYTPLDRALAENRTAAANAIAAAAGVCEGTSHAECPAPDISFESGRRGNFAFIVRGGELGAPGFINNVAAEDAEVVFSAAPDTLISINAGSVLYKGTQAGMMTGTVFGVRGATARLFVTVVGLASCDIGNGCAAFGLQGAADAGARLASLAAMELATVTMFVASGADVNEHIGGKFLLHHLATANRGGMISIFVSAGATVNARDDANNTPLDLAVSQNNTQAAEALINAGGICVASQSALCPAPEIGFGGVLNSVFVARGGALTESGYVGTVTAGVGGVSFSAIPDSLATVIAGSVLYKGTQTGAATATVIGVQGAAASLFVTLRGLASCNINNGCDAFGLQNAADANARLSVLLAMELRTVVMFAASGANLEENVGGYLLLHHLATANRAGMISVFATEGANVNAQNPAEDTPLHLAAAAGNIAAIHALVAAGANLRALDFSGNRPLHSAAGNGHAEAVATLLAAGARVTDTNDDGRTALDEAVRGNHTAAANLLVAAGGRCNRESDPPCPGPEIGFHGGINPIFVVRGSVAFVARGTVLTAPGYVGTVTAGESGVAFSAAPDSPLSVTAGSVLYKGTQLGTMTATVFGVKGATTRLFVTVRGLDVCDIGGVCDAFGFAGAANTDARLAVLLAMDLRTVTMLAASGADLHAPLQVGGHPILFHLAAENRPAHITAFVAAGVDINFADANDTTPLHIAASVGNITAVSVLLAAGANPEPEDDLVLEGSRFNVPLMYAAAGGFVNVINALLAAGADVNFGSLNHNPLDIAIIRGHAAAITALRAAGGTCTSQRGAHCR